VRIPLETLIDGVVETLTGSVLPDVSTRFARGQLFAVVDVLRNLRDRVELRAGLLAEEAASAEDALARAAGALGDTPAAADLRAAASGVPAGPPAARAGALRAAVAAAFDTLDSLPAELAAPARAALAGHLAAQAMRDVALLKPSLLAEISKG
jgi:hypothetical protein